MPIARIINPSDLNGPPVYEKPYRAHIRFLNDTGIDTWIHLAWRTTEGHMIALLVNDTDGTDPADARQGRTGDPGDYIIPWSSIQEIRKATTP